jgi:hypothetical protein
MNKNKPIIKDNRTNLSGMTNEQVISATEDIKDKTRQTGSRILRRLDETDELGNIIQDELDEHTDSMIRTTQNLDDLDVKVQESKTLAKKFKSWFGLFSTTKSTPIPIQSTIHEPKSVREKYIRVKKDDSEYEITSDDPADEIATKVMEKLEKLERHAQGFNEKLTKQVPLLDEISNKIDKSDCDIKATSAIIKRY